MNYHSRCLFWGGEQSKESSAQLHLELNTASHDQEVRLADGAAWQADQAVRQADRVARQADLGHQKRPRRAKRPHKRPYVRQNDARRRDLKVRQPETGGLPGGDRPRCTDRPPQKATGALKSRPGAPRRGTRGRQGGAVGHLNERHAAAFVDKI